MAPPVSLQGPSRLADGLVVATFGLLVVGASVRVHGAGLACPDWPLCFGRVIPPLDVGVAFEFGHRVLAGGISMGFLALLGWMWMRRQAVGRGLLLGGLVALAILAIQVVLGGLTVLELLAQWTVASHLLAGNAFCLGLLLLALGLRERIAPVQRAAVGPAERAFAVWMALAVPAQLVLGGLVSSSYAGLACGTWPTCDGQSWFPTFAGAVGLQLAHRLGAYLLLASAAVGLGLTRARGRAGRVSAWLFLVVLGQGALGVANVLLRLPVEITLLHTAGAAALVLCTGWLNWEVWRAPVRAPRGVVPLSAMPVEAP